MMLLISLSLAASLTAEAPRVPATIATKEGLDFVIATGPIDAGFSERLRAALDSNAAATSLEVESLGGLSEEAYAAANLLNDRGIGIRVRGRCASACALMWASAEQRILFEGARIGFHAGRPSRDPPAILRGAVQRHSSRLAAVAMAKAGFDDEMIERAANTPHESMLWLEVAEAKAAGAVFELAPRTTEPTP
ncbi:hypothetical protein [Alkalisalibacterium limincola]|uniref:Peptidase S14 n=1 Tax=Alkalisalibacterium limincola TaxID=2699169 RepID=A0A5C8KJ85_9GAMM|nr:hypothetical protein [Alkalisalibacterium limincola]TXK59044.1 hypothetical protein FU658_14165 [Alkalisalibacterium limincola]